MTHVGADARVPHVHPTCARLDLCGAETGSRHTEGFRTASSCLVSSRYRLGQLQTVCLQIGWDYKLGRHTQRYGPWPLVREPRQPPWQAPKRFTEGLGVLTQVSDQM